MVERFHKDYNSSMDSQFSMHFGRLGWTTNPQTGNQISELGKRLNEGVKNVEIGALSQDVFSAIPEQHMHEMRRLSELTESKLSFHAPLTDPSGFKEQNWHEHQRVLAEQEFKDVVDRAHDLDPKGNIPVNFHSSGGGVPAAINRKIKNGELEEKQFMGVVNTRTGQLQFLQKEEIDWLTTDKPAFTPEDRLNSLNQTSWDKELLEFMSLKKQKEEIGNLQSNWRTRSAQGQRLLDLEIKNKTSNLSKDEGEEILGLREQDEGYDKHKEEIDHNMMSQLNNIYNDYSKAFKYKNAAEKIEHQKRMADFANIKEKFLEQTNIQRKYDRELKDWVKEHQGGNIDNLGTEEFRKYQKSEEYRRLSSDYHDFRERRLKEMEGVLVKKELDILPEQAGNMVLNLPAPKRWRPVDELAVEKASDTFSNVAMHAYTEYTKKGGNAPLITVENVYPEWTLSRADSLKKMIEESKKKFVKQLMEKENLSKHEAKEVADKGLGVTWDVGHINMLRKYGYTKEDIIEESKKIAKHVKHLHLTDNFGYADSHLSPGMGNVPIKGQLKEIEKRVGKEEFEKMTKVIEAGGMFQQLQTNPIPYAVEGLNTSFYTYDHSPTWTDVRDIYASYLFGYGDKFLPDQHYKMRGAGFSLLPRELGGQIGGSNNDSSNFSGTPNQ